ncbi:hypothetical protein L6164_010951 [Bauhinia variegata]|uniref:Uncharacterized protein n=1 Tax=Bauhinia variegata TaxID=167791 RepID=A0ACB9P505_BAUVA|nr:hypothetical protein L6164_010951 [Bauhinia variegata]
MIFVDSLIDENSSVILVFHPAVIHMLAECSGLQWFESWGTKKLAQVGLPVMTPDHIIKVCEDEPVLQPFKLMRKKRVGVVTVIAKGGSRAVGNISLRDIQFLLTAPEIYHDYRAITVKDFMSAVKNYLEENKEDFPKLNDLITCKKNCTDHESINRVYVVDDDGNLEGLITLRDIISRLVDFFDGVLPQPANGRV